MSKLTPTDLETCDYGQPEWVAIYNRNVERLNALLLKIQALQDVDIDKLEDGALLMWKSSKGKWVPIKYD